MLLRCPCRIAPRRLYRKAVTSWNGSFFGRPHSAMKKPCKYDECIAHRCTDRVFTSQQAIPFVFTARAGSWLLAAIAGYPLPTTSQATAMHPRCTAMRATAELRSREEERRGESIHRGCEEQLCRATAAGRSIRSMKREGKGRL